MVDTSVSTRVSPKVDASADTEILTLSCPEPGPVAQLYQPATLPQILRSGHSP